MAQEELLQICDERGFAIGMAERGFAHRTGLLHQVVHCHMVEEREDGIWIYYQQRAFSKRDFPGYYDIAVAGHIDPAELPEQAACREIFEEAGLLISPEALRLLGKAREKIRIGEFFDREIGFVYVLEGKGLEFCLGEEVERMIRFRAEEFLAFQEEGQTEITAYPTGQGEPFLLQREELCRHDLRLILAYLKKWVGK